MSRIHAIEAGLAAWRDAERRLSEAGNGETQILTREVQHRRAEYQLLAAEQAEDRWQASDRQGLPTIAQTRG